MALLTSLAVACSSGGSSKVPAAGGESEVAGTAPTRSWAGKDPAPALPSGLQWFNVEHPLTLAQLRGKVVLLDFWTLGCINCQHIIPDLDRLQSEFGGDLAIVGVHSGKYATEHTDESVADAVRRLGIEHPVVNDADLATWDTYAVDAWPTLVIIDPAGNLVGKHAGEGVYPLLEPIVKSLIGEFGAKGALDSSPLPLKLNNATAATVLSYPSSIVADAARDRLFVADAGHNRILESGLDGTLRRAFGSGVSGFADGAPAEAAFRQPQGISLSADGATLYVADTRNHALRAIALASGEVTTIAGTGQQADRVPTRPSPPATTALASPWGIAVAGSSLYVTMAGVHQLWQLDLQANTIQVYAGTSREGIDDGPRRSRATLAQPSGIATDGSTLYWADPEGSAIRALAAGANESAEVQTLVGTGLFDYGAKDGDGTLARLQHAQGVALDGETLYVADTYNHRLRAIDLVSHQVTTFAGGERGWADGQREGARFDEPSGLAVGGGRLYVADTNNNLIRVVELLGGHVSTLQFSNLAVAALPAADGRIMRVDLPAITAAPDATSVRVVLKAPAGYHLNGQGPSHLAFESSDPAVLSIPSPQLGWATDEPEVHLDLPVQVHPGSATLTGRAMLYYCREGEEALCFLQQADIVMPLTIAPDAATAAIPFAYTLPERP